MVARYFCDICADEVQDAERQREFNTVVVLKKPPKGHTASRRVGLKLLRSIDGAWNAGHICNACLRTALAHVIARLDANGGKR